MKNETGRSMVEMLGVLAIIGVLSVAGIAGYTMAMRKVKANDILNVASQCAVLARTYQGVGLGSGVTANCGSTGSGTVNFGLEYNTTDATAMTATLAATGVVSVAVTTSGNELCKTMQSTAGSNASACGEGNATTLTYNM